MCPIQASLNTVLAAVEERTARQNSGAMEASVGCAPTTVEDCLQASGFSAVRKVCTSMSPPYQPLTHLSLRPSGPVAGEEQLNVQGDGFRVVGTQLMPTTLKDCLQARGLCAMRNLRAD